LEKAEDRVTTSTLVRSVLGKATVEDHRRSGL